MSNEFDAHKQCEQLIYKVLRVLETEMGKVADFFTKDGQFFNFHGQEKIREHFSHIQTVDHNINVNLCSNLIIDVMDEAHAQATNYVTHYVSDPEPGDLKDPGGGLISGELVTARSLTRWSWQFEHEEGRWLISKLDYPETVLLREDVLNDVRGSS